MYSSIFVILSPWKRTGHFIWTNLNPLHSRMLYVKFGWNWPSCSGEEDESVKSLQRQRRQRIKLTWAFGSDELKTERIIGFITVYKILPKVYTVAFLNRAVFCRKLWFYILSYLHHENLNPPPPPRVHLIFHQRTCTCILISHALNTFNRSGPPMLLAEKLRTALNTIHSHSLTQSINQIMTYL